MEFDSLGQTDSGPGSLAAIAAHLENFDLRFVASYIDYVIPDRGLFVSANALFALPSSDTACSTKPQGPMISPNAAVQI